MIGQIAGNWWGLVLLGVCAGILSGTLGVGGGIIMVPGLVLLFGLPQKSAQGAALAVMIPTALLGALRYWWNPRIEVNLAVVGLVAAGALVGTLIGTELAGRLPAHVLRKAFAIFVIAVAVKLLLTPARPAPPGGGGAGTRQTRQSTPTNQEGAAPDDSAGTQADR